MNLSLSRIPLFHEFLLENSSSKILRFPMVVTEHRNPETQNRLKDMNMKNENFLFDRKTPDEFDSPVSANVPVLNHLSAQDGDSSKMMNVLLDKKIVSLSQLYNKPNEKEKVSDKVKFHKIFEGADFVPKTVYSERDLDQLKFPVIAKPSSERSGTGIVKLDKIEDLKKYKNQKFDLFSEAIKINREYRCFCFRKEMLSLDERIDTEDKSFLDDPETKTAFAYKNIPEFKKQNELDKLIDEALKEIKLDYFSLDFAEDEDGKLWLIEMNSNTGVGVEKQCKLYLAIHKDFFGKEASKQDQETLQKRIAEYREAYKNDRLNECTTVATRLNGRVYLFKNRDRSFTPENKIVHEKIEGVEVAYYTDQTGWVEGMNEHGIGFVFSSNEGSDIETYDKAYTVSDEPKRDSKKFFKPFSKEFKSLLTSKTIEEAMEKIERQKKSGNFLISNGRRTYEFERFNGESKGRRLFLKNGDYYVKTNHGELIPGAGHQYNPKQIKRASSDLRKAQAELQLTGIKDPMEIAPRMQFQHFDPKSSLNTFRTDSEEYTISQCLMMLRDRELHFFHNATTADSISLDDKMTGEEKIKIVVHKG